MMGSLWSLLSAAATPQAGEEVYTQKLSSQTRVFSFQAILSGSGLVTASVNLEVTNDGVNWKTMHTFSLTGTALDQDAVVLTLPFVKIRASLSTITGTSAKVSVYMSE